MMGNSGHITDVCTRLLRRSYNGNKSKKRVIFPRRFHRGVPHGCVTKRVIYREDIYMIIIIIFYFIALPSQTFTAIPL